CGGRGLREQILAAAPVVGRGETTPLPPTRSADLTPSPKSPPAAPGDTPFPPDGFIRVGGNGTATTGGATTRGSLPPPAFGCRVHPRQSNRVRNSSAHSSTDSRQQHANTPRCRP